MSKKSIEIRQQAILDITNQLGEIRFSQLRTLFPEVSEVTLRKDLSSLEEQGQIIRTHGGVKAIPNVLNFAFRNGLHQEEKLTIGTKAAKLIKENDTVFITAGTTCSALAQVFPTFNLNIVTDGLITATLLPCSPSVHVEILGGEIDLNVKRVVDINNLNVLDTMHFNIAFLGVPGFHPKYGFATLSSNTAAIFQKVIASSDKVVVLMDSSKVNYSYTPRTIPLNAVDIVVSDGMLEENIVKALNDAGVEIL